MPFLNPIVFVTGAAAASLPVIIYLLNRRRYRIRDWAAMQFLLASLRKNRKRLRIEELILLLIRTLIVLLLALALGRFTGCTDVLMGLGGEESRTVVFVLDDSYSMGQSHGDVSLYDLARQKLKDRIGQLSETDSVSVILTSRPKEKVFFPAQQLTDPDTLLADLDAQDLSDQRTSLASALAAAGAILGGEQGRRELVVLSDMRSVDMDGGSQGSQLQEQLNALRDQNVSITMLDYGLAPENNVTIESIELVDRQVVINQEAEFRITLRNNGPEAISNVKIKIQTVRQKDEGLVETDADPVIIKGIASGATVSETFKNIFAKDGPVVIQAELVEDDLPGDNTRHLALEVQPPTKVLIVDGGSPRDGVYGASVMPNVALAPFPEYPDAMGFAPSVRYYSELESVNFNEYDMVVLSDVPDMPQQIDSKGKIVYPKLRELEQFVSSGGGLIVFSGDRLELKFYNGPMYANGLGLNPFKISAPIEAKDLVKNKARPFLQISPSDIQPHPALDQVFGENPELLADVFHFVKYTPVDTTASRAAGAERPRTLLKLIDPAKPDQSASPLVVSQAFGSGSVMMFYTTSNTFWSDWPKDDTFLVVMSEAVLSMARGNNRDFTATLPASVNLELPSQLGGQFAASLIRFPTGDLGQQKARRRYKVLIADLLELIELAPDQVSGPLAQKTRQLKQEALLAHSLLSPTELKALGKLQAELAFMIDELEPSPTKNRVLQALKREPTELSKHELDWPRISKAGIYSLDVQASPSVIKQSGLSEKLLIARNVDPLEGQIQPAHAQLIDEVIGEVDTYQAMVRQTDRNQENSQAGGDADWWAWAMGILAAMVLLETVLGLKFGHYTRSQKQG